MYSISFLVLAVSSSVSYSFIQPAARSTNAFTSSRRFMSDEPTSETAADMFASPPVLSTLSESGELEIDFDSLGMRPNINFCVVDRRILYLALPAAATTCVMLMIIALYFLHHSNIQLPNQLRLHSLLRPISQVCM